MKIKHYIVSFLFLVFAAVQYNDPDPWLWILLYLFVAAIPLLYIKGSLHSKVLGLIMIPLFLKTSLYVPDLMQWVRAGMPTITGSMQAESPHIELIREFFGMVLCLVVVWYYYLKSKDSS